MATFHDLTTSQLRQAVKLKEQIESLQEKLNTLMGGTAPATAAPTKGKRVMSAATRKKMAAAQQARYAKMKTPATPAGTVSKKSANTVTNSALKKRQFSPETKAKLAAAMKARWAAKKASE